MPPTTQPAPRAGGPIGRDGQHPLEVFFSPRNVAVVGATESQGSVGRTILWNLISSPFGGTVFPVNPKRPSVLGIKAYPEIGAIDEPVDLAVVVTPAKAVPKITEQCVAAGVRGMVIISAGFKEAGPEGNELARRVLDAASGTRMRIIGPNCLGVMSPLSGLNATFASGIARPGNVGFISQSGALCTSVLDWSLRERVGFSGFISIGSMLDVDWGDLIDYLGRDPKTRSIIIYMESIGNAQSFLSAAREIALSKPIIVIKAGRTAAAAKAAASHTGSLTGSDEVLDAAFRRCGVLRVKEIADLFAMTEVLAKQPLPRGKRLTILTNAGGPGVLATDTLVEGGGELASISEPTRKELDAILPAHWSHNNPIDILGDAGPERYAESLKVSAGDPESDGLLVILTPQAMTDPTQTADKLKAYGKLENKPVLCSWMGGADVAAGVDVLNHAGIPSFEYPDTAARMFNYMWRYSHNLHTLYETPSLPAPSDQDAPDRAAAQKIIQHVRDTNRAILTEYESKQVLEAYRIPTVETRLAAGADEAVALAGEVGYPVVLKLNSETITHKTDVGGVQLNLRNADQVRTAYKAIEDGVTTREGPGHFLGVTVQPMVSLEGYEIILGSSVDPQMGPVLLFGSGGQLVEVFRDRALAIPPLNTTLARRMMEETKILKALKGTRGRPPVDIAALELLLVRFSQLTVEQRSISELDINPLLASPERVIALDARVVLNDPATNEDELPRPAIRPYPIEYISSCRLKNGTEIRVRPIRPEDEPLMVKFHEGLSDQTVALRYYEPVSLDRRVTHERLVRICFNDFDNEIALVAERTGPSSGDAILGVGRLRKIRGTRDARFTAVVTDKFQNQGLGAVLLSKLFEIGRKEKLERAWTEILPDNQPMLHLAKKMGIEVAPREDGKRLRAVMRL